VRACGTWLAERGAPKAFRTWTWSRASSKQACAAPTLQAAEGVKARRGVKVSGEDVPTS
jgi:hypothetical protein